MTSEITVTLKPDGHGMIGRQCPEDNCGLYFKLKLGTGWDTEHIRCPYCRSEGHQSSFFTQDQMEYARSVAVRDVVGPILKGFKKDIERTNRRRSSGLIQLKFSVDYKPISVRHYIERQLETEVSCDNCSLEFSVYGVFASCPCCGQLNALKVMLSSLETAKRKLLLSEEPSLDSELRQDFVKDALTGSVSAFDAFGKALAKNQPILFPENRRNLFQDIEALNGHLQTQGIPSFETTIGISAWEELKWFFQARHVYVHNAGVIDERFTSRQPALAYMQGRVLPLESERLAQDIDVLGSLCRELDSRFNTPWHEFGANSKTGT